MSKAQSKNKLTKEKVFAALKEAGFKEKKPTKRQREKEDQDKQEAAFLDNAKMTITMECNGCGDTALYEAELFSFAAEEIAGDAARQFYADGWRDTDSTALGLTGILCPECVKHKDNPKSKHWDF